MIQRFLAPVLALIFVVVVNPGAVAEDLRVNPRAVVELFTSQGCEGCPPADAFIAELAKQNDVVVLSYHVDYWNYIGWKDTFGDPAFSEFQRSYAQSWRKSRVYTPQLVINGVKDMVGSHRKDVEAAIGSASLPINVQLSYEKGVLSVNAGPDPSLPELTVWLVTFLSKAEVDIDSGDNSGKTLSYAQIVTGRQVLGMWDPEAGAQIKLPLYDVLKGVSDGVAIIVQYQKDGLPGQIYGAASFTM